MKQPHTKLRQVEGRFGADTTTEEAIMRQVLAALEGFLGEYQRQGAAGELRSIRGVAMINFTGGVGGKFVLDMRLLPTDEVEEDELFKMVDAHVKEQMADDPPHPSSTD